MPKRFLLTLLSFFVVVLLLNSGRYQEWFREKPVHYWSDFLQQAAGSADATEIMTKRYGISYTMSLKIRAVVTQKKVAHPVILFEPNSYYRDSLHIDIRVPEPAVFYYYTGLQGVWTNSPNVNQANFILRVSKKGANLDDIRSPEQLQKILDYYRKYAPTL